MSSPSPSRWPIARWPSYLVSLLSLLTLHTHAQLNNMQTDLTVTPPKCRDLTYIWARGTDQADNFGGGPGQAIAAEIIKQKGQAAVALQGVEKQYYPAVGVNNFANMPHDTDTGGQRVADLVGIAQKGCARTKMVLVGYSQGAGVLHKAAKALSPALAQFISSIVVFGDVYVDQTFGSVAKASIKSFCHTGDQWCDKGDTAATAEQKATAHSSYDSDIAAAVAFILERAGTVSASANNGSSVANTTASNVFGDGGVGTSIVQNPSTQLRSSADANVGTCKKRKRSRVGRKRRRGGRRGSSVNDVAKMA